MPTVFLYKFILAADCSLDLTVDRTLVPDSAFTASSSHSSTLPHHGRLTNVYDVSDALNTNYGYFRPGTPHEKQWLQVWYENSIIHHLENTNR